MTIANGGIIVYTDIDGLNPSPTPLFLIVKITTLEQIIKEFNDAN
jgi:hypothetical protein